MTSDTKGRPRSIVGIEELLSSSSVLDFASDAVITTDVDFRVTGWNKTAEEMYGWRAEEVIGKPVHEVTGIEYVHDKREDVLRDFHQKGYWKGDVIQKRKDGTLLRVATSVSLVRDSSGQQVGILALNRDITEHVRTEEALRRSEERYRSLVERTGVGVATSDAEGNFTYVNDSLCQMIDYSREELIGEAFIDFIHPEDQKKVLGLILAAFDNPDNEEELEFRVLSIDRDREKIALGLKQKEENPWEKVAERYPVGARIRGEVVNIMNYGAFVKLEPGVEGSCTSPR